VYVGVETIEKGFVGGLNGSQEDFHGSILCIVVEFLGEFERMTQVSRNTNI
jgi:hypothetical protein